MKNDLSMVSHEKTSFEERKFASIQSSVISSHNDIGVQLKTLLDSTAKETDSFLEKNKAKHNNEHDELKKVKSSSGRIQFC